MASKYVQQHEDLGNSSQMPEIEKIQSQWEMQPIPAKTTIRPKTWPGWEMGGDSKSRPRDIISSPMREIGRLQNWIPAKEKEVFLSPDPNPFQKEKLDVLL